MKQSLAKAGLIVMFLNGFAIVAAFVREATIAYYYGASAELDAFWVALSVPRFVGEGLVTAIVMSLIPVFAKIRAEESEQEMVKKASNIACVNLLGLAVFVGTYMMVAPFVIRALAPGFESYRYNLALRLTLALAPISLLWGALGVLKAFHNVLHRFTFPELARVLVSIGVIVTLPIFASQYGIFAMPTGFIGGLAVGIVLNALPLLSIRSLLRLRLVLSAPEVRNYIKMLLPVLATSGIYYIHAIVDNIFASMLDPGAVSALRYAALVVAVPASLIGGALATVLFPRFADLAATKRYNELKTKVDRGLTIGLFVGLLSLCLFFGFGHAVMRVLYARGNFSYETAGTCSTLALIYSAGSAGGIMSGIAGRVLWATMRVKVIVIITIAAVVANVCLNAVLVRFFGVYGLAAATAVVAWLRYILIVVSVRRLTRVDVRLVGRIELGLLAMLFSAFSIAFIFRSLPWDTRPFLGAVTKIAIGITCISVSCLLVGRLTKSQTLNSLLVALRSVFVVFRGGKRGDAGGNV